MADLLTRLRGLFQRRSEPELSDDEVRRLQNDFKGRYHQFKLLLAANSRALEIMAELDYALADRRLYGMSFVRSRCTGVGVSVYAMIKNLVALAPGEYEGLFERFKVIQDRIDQGLAARPADLGGDLVIPMEQVDLSRLDEVGGKMANLGHIRASLGARVPPGFAITTSAYRLLFEHNRLQEEINRLLQTTVLDRVGQLFSLSSRLRQLIVRAEIPPPLRRAVEEAYQVLEQETEPGVMVSLRSSAVGEDSARSSFAGQYRSQINVHPDRLLESYREVVASKYTPQAMQYRYLRGLRDEDLPMSVGCMATVKALAGGVAYTTNPLDIRDRNVHISSAWGLPKAVVDGEASTDQFVITRNHPPSISQRIVAHKESQIVCHGEGGVCRLEVTGENAGRCSLDDQTVLRLAEVALGLEEHYGAPQDVEWAITERGDLVILQCRPLRQSEPISRQGPVSSVDAEVRCSGGVAASPGVASGPVCWVREESHTLGFAPGSVLVVDQPWPRWATLLGQCSAVVAAQGNLAGHLATVCREYRVPALFGVGESVDRLANGETVTVDAEGLKVYAGRVAPILAQDRPEMNLMAGSPVQRTLQEAAASITPLTMLDPDSPEFRPRSCQSLHDITRFCHEKSVHEMFDFGKRHSFPQRSAKQLHFHVPMQYWVINLDDGFGQEVSGKYVRMGNIVSIPMLALWEGIIAVPWDGPPAISGRGLASVMFQATANPELASPFRAPMAEGNYFMISKNFMSLQARYGFHFSTVEALVSERHKENYLSFSFSGGAADPRRRKGRVQFIAELLQEQGFLVSLREDVLRSRVDSLGQEEMTTRLKVVGYLLMHTRQLDMIMADPVQVERYRSKFFEDLNQITDANNRSWHPD